jgi:hypothetical protein
MLAGQGFGRWGFVLGNVLIAFGAPVFVTGLISAVAAGRADIPAPGEDIASIVAGSVFMIAGMVFTVTAGRVRMVQPPPFLGTPVAEAPPVVAPQPHAVDPLPLTFNTLDDYYAQPDGGVAITDDDLPATRVVPRPRNSRGWAGSDRFCEPSVTGTRWSGSRRRPPA